MLKEISNVMEKLNDFSEEARMLFSAELADVGAVLIITVCLRRLIRS